MQYEKDFYQGMPVLTCNNFGKGKAFYVCADMEQAFYTDVLKRVAAQEGIRTPMGSIPDGVEVCTRESEEYLYTFVQNFSQAPADISMPEQAEPWFGAENNGKLPVYGTAVYRTKK